MKLNVCCGGRVLPEYTNIDIAAAPGKPTPNIIADARNIPLDDGVADEVMCIHGFEHFYKWETPDLLKEWFRLLKPEGVLVLEMPDIIKCCKNIIEGKMRGGKDPEQLGYWGAFGDPRGKNPYMGHKWGWTYKTVKPLLIKHGFREVAELPTKWHPAGRDFRDFRVEARK